MWKITFLLLLIPCVSGAATKYVREDYDAGVDQNYGAEDGSSYAAAYDGLSDISLSDGDYLYFCGTHDNGFNDNILTISGVSNVTVDFNCPSDQGVLISAGFRYTSGWTGPDGFGAYSRTYTGQTGMHLVEDSTRLVKETGAPDGTWAAGTFSQDGTTLYYKPSSGVPGDHVVYTTQADAIVISNAPGTTIIDADVRGLSLDSCIDITSSDNVTLTRPKLKWCKNYAVSVKSDSDYLTVTNPDISESGNGIYIISQQNSDNSDYFIITGDGTDDIHDLDQAGYYSDVTDNHAIGIQGGSYGHISGMDINTLRGSCITFYTYGTDATDGVSQNQAYNRIERNKCRMVEDTNAIGSSEYGIEYGNSNAGHDPDRTVGNIVVGNIIDTVAASCIRTKSQASTLGTTWAFYHNTLKACDVAFEFRDEAAGNTAFAFKNNLIMGTVTKQIDHVNNGTDTLTGADFDNNMWSPDGAAQFEWNGTNYTLANWQAQSGDSTSFIGSVQFAGSSYVPLMVSPNNGRGASGVTCIDFDGPLCLAPFDIGAHQSKWLINRPGARQ